MATVEVSSQNGATMPMSPLEMPLAKRKRETDTPLIDYHRGDMNLKKEIFDAEKHLIHSSFPKTYSMSDLSFPEDRGISKVAVSEPFPLFSEDAIKQMRAEVLSQEVWNNCKYSSNLAQCQLRGFAPE